MTTRRDVMRLLGAATLAAGPLPGVLARPQAAAGAGGSGAAGTVYTSAKDSRERFAPRALGTFTKAGQPLETDISVFVDSRQRYQTVFGFGGAVTDATADVYAKLTPAAQQAYLEAYFDPHKGLGYNVLRTTIHSSDFGTHSYTYVKPNDRALSSFSIAPDLARRIPLLRQSLAAGKAAGSQMRVMASPWSAPEWMKSNNSMLAGGSLLPEHHDTWARYIVRFVQEYEKAGIPLWGLSVQNEPMAKQTWESMIYSAEDEARFLGDHLGPALKKAGYGGKKIVVWDHNRDLLPQRAAHILSDPKARPYIWGVGYHWYETWSGGEPMHRNLAAVHQAWPDVNLLMTEGCIEKFDPAKMQLWDNGERYGAQMIGDLAVGGCGWIDWNMLLDMRGGPNHKNNFCFAPLHASDDGQLIFTPIFSYIGHFSRYIKPGARRVSATTSRSTLDTVGFRNPDGSLAIVVMNKTDAPQRYRLQIDRMEVAVDIPARAIQTVVR